MKHDSDWRHLEPQTDFVDVTFGERQVLVRNGGILAAELLAAGVTTLRQTPVSGSTRGPFCMMGACFDCLVEIDGATVQACMTRVVPGLVVRPATGLLQTSKATDD